MKLIQLPFAQQIQDQIDDPLIQVVLGPRQSGKTTTLLNLLETRYKPTEYSYESCDGQTTTLNRLIELWQNTLDNKILVLDEIQKLENWSEHIKKLWDENKRKKIKTRCVLLGSSSLQIQKGLSESLTGRFELVRSWHWNSRESFDGYNVDFDNYCRFGGYPGSYPFIKNPKRWKSYLNESIVATVIEKDILHFNRVKSPSLFKQSFSIISHYPAQEISYNKLLGQIQDKGNVDLVKYYLELFEGAYLIKCIYKYSGRKIISKSSSPKIIPMCPALATYHLRETLDKDYLGRIFESIIGSALIRAGYELYYWRLANAEVDFVIEVNSQPVAIEVKSGRRKSSKGLLEFEKHFPKSKMIVISLENYEKFIKNPNEFIKKLIF